ncbi:hypothetical protein TNCV_2179701 [Trichonephila clavipes]|uniref:Uncharacterized protein n=1 Tax=Trichonephila clavipes TaxID=2585209 RepID=A0A8X6VUH8_TRICX|nr:hypothetical protein TNCV_2179701 [Trichonephila clavipes]
MCLILFNKTALSGNEAYLSVMLKMVSFSTHLDSDLHFLLHFLQLDALAQAHVIGFRSSCVVDVGIAYMLCLMYHRKKKSSEIRSDERASYSTQQPYPMTCGRNVSRKEFVTCDDLCSMVLLC